MEVIYPKYPGRILLCGGCGAILHYENSDIYGANLVYCPICKFQNVIEYDKNYDGIITEEKKDVQS